MSSETTQRTNRKSDRTKKQRIGPDKEKKKKKRRDEDGQVPDDEEERKESSDLFTTVDELTKSLKRRASEAKLDVEKKILFSEKSVRRRSRSMDRLESPREELLESEVEEVLEKLKGQIQLPRKDDGAQTPPKPSSILGNSHNQIPPRSGLSPSASSSNIPSVTTSTVPSSTGHYPKQTQNRPQNSGNSQFSSSLLSPPTSSYFSAEWSSGPAPSSKSNASFPPPLLSTGQSPSALPDKKARRKFDGGDRQVRLNIGGTIFETYASTLAKFPHTLLGQMFHPKNIQNIDWEASEQAFFDRDPLAFEVILNYYRNSKIIIPHWLPIEVVYEEFKFFSLDVPSDQDHKRISVEIMKIEYKTKLWDAAEYRRIARHKLLTQYQGSLVGILDLFGKKIETHASLGHNSCSVVFYSPLHYTDSTPSSMFNVIAKNEIRELIRDILQERHFYVEENNEYSKQKQTNVIGLNDQVPIYADPKYFSFYVKWTEQPNTNDLVM